MFAPHDLVYLSRNVSSGGLGYNCGMTDNAQFAMPRPVRDSQSEMNEIVLPNDANPLGALLGGRLMHWIDVAGAMAAHRHSRNYVAVSYTHLDVYKRQAQQGSPSASVRRSPCRL